MLRNSNNSFDENPSVECIKEEDGENDSSSDNVSDNNFDHDESDVDISFNISESDDSWDEKSNAGEDSSEESAEEPLYLNAQEVREMIKQSTTDTRDIALFDPIPVVRSESKESQEETLATLESLLLVRENNFV